MEHIISGLVSCELSSDILVGRVDWGPDTELLGPGGCCVVPMASGSKDPTSGDVEYVLGLGCEARV